MCAAASASGLQRAPATAAPPTLAELVGQRLVVAMAGTRANPQILARIRAGQVGGVILFSHEHRLSEPQLTALTASLQAAATGRRTASARSSPPTRRAARSGASPGRRRNGRPGSSGSCPASRSMTSGANTGAALRADGVNVDLAPVADVPAGPADFIEQQKRAFSTNRFTRRERRTGVRRGARAGRRVADAQALPGPGPRDRLDRRCARADHRAAGDAREGPPALPGRLPARARPDRDALDRGLSGARPRAPRPGRRRSSTASCAAASGSRGVTITDSLDSAAAVRHESDPVVALRSAEAGADLLLITGSAGREPRRLLSICWPRRCPGRSRDRG